MFLKSFFFGDRFHQIRVDSRSKRRGKSPFSSESGYVWTGP